MTIRPNYVMTIPKSSLGSIFYKKNALGRFWPCLAILVRAGLRSGKIHQNGHKKMSPFSSWRRFGAQKPPHLGPFIGGDSVRVRSLWVCRGSLNTKTIILQPLTLKKIGSDFFLAKMSATIFGTFQTKKNRKIDFSARNQR